MAGGIFTSGGGGGGGLGKFGGGGGGVRKGAPRPPPTRKYIFRGPLLPVFAMCCRTAASAATQRPGEIQCKPAASTAARCLAWGQGLRWARVVRPPPRAHGPIHSTFSRSNDRGGGLVGSKFGVSIWPPNLPREIQEFCAFGTRGFKACFLGVSAKCTTLNPGASAKFPIAKLTTAKLTRHQAPPPPCMCSTMGPHKHHSWS